MKALLIPVTGPIANVEIPEESARVLERLRDLLGGRIERLPLPRLTSAPEAVACIDGEAKIQGMPANRRATELLVPGAGIPRDDYVAGPCLVVGKGEDGEMTDLPGEIVARVLALA